MFSSYDVVERSKPYFVLRQGNRKTARQTKVFTAFMASLNIKKETAEKARKLLGLQWSVRLEISIVMHVTHLEAS